jgi:hypothetical protein
LLFVHASLALPRQIRYKPTLWQNLLSRRIAYRWGDIAEKIQADAKIVNIKKEIHSENYAGIAEEFNEKSARK